MIGIWGAHAQTYLIVLMVTTTSVFALPIFLTPLAWARVFLWKIPQEQHLTVYFGRCLGAFILIAEALMLRAGLYGTGIEFTFQVLLAIAASMVVVHVWGAVAKIQPITETIETGMYSGMFVLTLLFYPT